MGALLLAQSLFGVWADPPEPVALAIAINAAAAVALLFLTVARDPTHAMVVVPAIALAALGVASEPARDAFAHPARYVPWGATLVGFAMSLSAASGQSPPEEVRRGALAPSRRRTLAPILAAGAPLLLLAGGAGVVLADLGAHQGVSESALLAHAALVFLWSIAVYAFFVVPLANAPQARARARADAAWWHLPDVRRRRRLEAGLLVAAILAALLALFAA